MSISERIGNTLESWSERWKDKLRGWMLRTLSEGIKDFLEKDEPEAIDDIKDMIAKLRASPNIPPELKTKLDKLLLGGSWFMIVMAVVMGVQAIIGLVTTIWQPGLKSMSYPEERIAKNFRFDPGSVIAAWRRDKPKYEKLFDDLRDLGWSDDRIEALKFVTLFIPNAAEQTLWLAREVYEPQMVAKYGLGSEMPVYEETDFDKIGVSPDQMKNIWMAHWQHASFMQMVEMLHRKLITEEDMWEWFRLVEIVPFWRDKLIQIAYTWPTRVDVRRWWDMRVIDEARLKELYEGMGYRGENLEDYIKWTKVYTDFPMMIARFTKGWIKEDEIYNWLIAQGIPAERAKHFIEEKIKPEAPERVSAERSATATEIMKAVKKAYITWNEGIERLGRMGYSESEADFKLRVYVGVAEGSPETYMEFVEWTESYRKAVGLDYQLPPQELVEASKALKETEVALKEAEEKGVKDAKLAPYLKAVSDAQYRYRQFLVKWEAEKKAT